MTLTPSSRPSGRGGATAWATRLGYYLLTGMAVAGLMYINGYPLVYSDSGAYMGNSFDLLPSEDRPIGYALIIRAVTWQSTMWTVPLFQGIVVSWLLMLVVREQVAEERQWRPAHLVLITLLLLCSSLPWYAGQLMADIYTPLVGLLLYLLFRGRRLGPWREGTLWVFLFFFIATHNAHFVMVAVLAVLLLWRAWRAGAEGRARPFRLRWAGLVVALAGSALLVMGFHQAAHGRMQLSRAGNVFLTGRLCESGIMQDYLAHRCPAVDDPLCAYRDHLPTDAGDLLWSSDQFVAVEHLTIGQADSLLAPVVGDVLSRPVYLAWFLRNSLLATVVELCQFEAGAGLDKYTAGSSPRFQLEAHLPNELNRYDHTRQQWGAYFDREDTNRRIGITLILSILVIALRWVADAREGSGRAGSLARWMAAWVVLNAAVAGTFAVIDPRLQSRVMWLLPLAAFFVLWEVGSRRFFNLQPRPAGPVSSS